MEKGATVPVVITVYKDRTFDFITKLPPVSHYLKKAAKIEKGNSTPGRSVEGKITMKQIEEIANQKMPDLNAFTVESAMRMVAGTARSMGITVKGQAPF